jgi:hypothetical protein
MEELLSAAEELIKLDKKIELEDITKEENKRDFENYSDLRLYIENYIFGLVTKEEDIDKLRETVKILRKCMDLAKEYKDIYRSGYFLGLSSLVSLKILLKKGHSKCKF